MGWGKGGGWKQKRRGTAEPGVGLHGRKTRRCLGIPKGKAKRGKKMCRSHCFKRTDMEGGTKARPISFLYAVNKDGGEG